ncbi:unnamed protein product, partial [Rotaria magnacalcarata]
MDALTDDHFLRENGLTKTVGMNLGSTSNVNDIDDAPDYNEEFPHLKSANSLDLSRSNTFFSSSSFASSLNGSLGNTTAALYTSSRIDEDRRRQIAIHEKSATTKI